MTAVITLHATMQEEPGTRSLMLISSLEEERQTQQLEAIKKIDLLLCPRSVFYKYFYTSSETSLLNTNCIDSEDVRTVHISKLHQPTIKRH